MVSIDEPVENAWMRARARCECRRGTHHQEDRCPQDLVWEQRGRRGHRGGWEVYHNSPRVHAGWEAVKQIEILCWECYQAVARAGFSTPRSTRDRFASSVGRCRGVRSA
jgi:hypothetical protein